VATGTLASAQALRFGRLLASAQAASRTRHTQPGLMPGISRISLAPPAGAPPLPTSPTAAYGQPAAPAAGPGGGLAYHTLTLKFTGPGGTAGTAIGLVQNVDDSNLSPGDQQPIGLAGEPGIIFAEAQGSYSLTVPDGSYSAEFSIITPHSGTFLGYDAALVVNPQFTVDSNLTVALNARTAVPYHVTLGGITAPPVQTDELGIERASLAGPDVSVGPVSAFASYMDLISVSGDGYTGSQLSATPTAAVTTGTFGFDAAAWLGASPLDGAEPDPTYALNFPAAGQIPSSLSYTVWRRDLTAYHQKLYANPLGTCGNDDTVNTFVYQPTGVMRWQYEVPPGGSRTDYWYDADPRLDLWQPTLQPADCSGLGASVWLADALRQIHQGGQVTETWNKAPLAAPPAAPPPFEFNSLDQNNPVLTLCPACRQGDNAFVTLTPYGDSVAAHEEEGANNNDAPDGTSGLTFYQNGKLAITSPDCENLTTGKYLPCGKAPDGLELPLLAQAASYRLDWSYLDWYYDPVAATTVDWTFRSAPDAAAGRLPGGEQCAPDPTQGCSYLPLLFIGYDLALNQDGQARAGQSFPVTFTVLHQQGEAPPQGVSATVSASFDNGKTWTTPRAAASLGGGRFTATIAQPSLPDTSGFVSLRVTARDGAGDAVTETLIKAYGLTG
jgi:hypothetical protein